MRDVESEEAGTADPAVIAVTSGYTRDYREGLTPWMVALATTPEGEIPLFVQLWQATAVTNGACSPRVRPWMSTCARAMKQLGCLWQTRASPAVRRGRASIRRAARGSVECRKR